MSLLSQLKNLAVFTINSAQNGRILAVFLTFKFVYNFQPFFEVPPFTIHISQK